MSRNTNPPRHLIGDRVASAKDKAAKVHEEVQLAEADLHLANLVITEKLAESVPDAELAKAVRHNEAAEAKLRRAGEELEMVADLLSSEERDRKRLEDTLARFRDANDAVSLAGGRSGEGSVSVIEHLRELTRHKVSADHPDPVRIDVLPTAPPASS